MHRDGCLSVVDAVLVQRHLTELRDPGRVLISDTNVSTADRTMTVTVTVENTDGVGGLQTVRIRLVTRDLYLAGLLLTGTVDAVLVGRPG